MAQRRDLRPQETGSDGLERAGIGECGVEGGAHEDGPDEPEADRLQGRASIESLGWAWWPESPRIGYAPLESRTKRWAKESPIEGLFPPASGERLGCKRLSDCDTEPTARSSNTALRNRSGISTNADAGGQNLSRRCMGGVRLDSQPHRRRNYNRPMDA